MTVHRKGNDGVGTEYTDFLPATLFGKTAETFLKYVHKGDMVHLAGRLQANEWKRDDKAGVSLSFLVEQLTLLPNNRQSATATPGLKKV